MTTEISETLVPVDDLLLSLSDACIRTANRIEAVTSSSALGGGHRYAVPSFKVTVKMSFTKTGDTVKGVLFWKKSEGFESQSLSEISMDIVALPRNG